MPFTPYHMGPGLLIKSALRPRFSLIIFGWTQIVTDLEPLIAILRGRGQLHGYSHTFLGGTLVAVFCAASAKYLLDMLSRFSLPFGSSFQISWFVAFPSAFVGSYSHVILDGLMHFDVTPFAPYSFLNPLLGYISVRRLHDFCLIAGLLGALIYVVVAGLRAVK